MQRTHTVGRSSRLRLFCAVLVAALLAPPIQAADYPTKPVRLVCAHVAGGAVDIFARVLGQNLSEAWGQSVLIDNRAGAAGSVAAQTVARAAPDGYTLMLSTNAPLTTNPWLYRALGYDWTDFEPVALVAEGPVAVIVNPALPVTSVQSLLDYARQRPAEVLTASAGSGSIGHFLVAELHREYGIKLAHVPYKGGVQAALAVATGEVGLGFIDPGASAPLIRDGRLRVLAVTTTRRSSTLPEVPTLKELGIPGFDVAIWVGLTGPRGLPREVVAKINADARAVLRDPQVRARLVASGLEPVDSMNASEFAAFIRQDAPRWQTRVRDAGLTVD